MLELTPSTVSLIGNWNDIAPLCQPVDCGRLPVKNHSKLSLICEFSKFTSRKNLHNFFLTKIPVKYR